MPWLFFSPEYWHVHFFKLLYYSCFKKLSGPVRGRLFPFSAMTLNTEALFQVSGLLLGVPPTQTYVGSVLNDYNDNILYLLTMCTAGQVYCSCIVD